MNLNAYAITISIGTTPTTVIPRFKNDSNELHSFFSDETIELGTAISYNGINYKVVNQLRSLVGKFEYYVQVTP